MSADGKVHLATERELARLLKAKPVTEAPACANCWAFQADLARMIRWHGLMSAAWVAAAAEAARLRQENAALRGQVDRMREMAGGGGRVGGG